MCEMQLLHACVTTVWSHNALRGQIWHTRRTSNWKIRKRRRGKKKCLPVYMDSYYRDNSRFVPSQWETVLLCNDVSDCQRASLDQACYYIGQTTTRPPLVVLGNPIPVIRHVCIEANLLSCLSFPETWYIMCVIIEDFTGTAKYI